MPSASLGPGGRGTHEHHGVVNRVDILTGTLGKAIGGASGGYVSARREMVETLRQRARPYLFSNSLAPPVAAASLRALGLIESSHELREQPAGQHRPLPRTYDRARLRCSPGRAPDRAGDGRRRGAVQRASRPSSPDSVCMRSASPIRWCREARPASARRCRLRTPSGTWTSRPSSSSPRASASPADHARASGPANSVVIVLTARQLPDVVSVS